MQEPLSSPTCARKGTRFIQPLEVLHQPGALLRCTTVLALTGWSNATLYRRIAALSGSLSGMLSTSLWAELYSPARLPEVRSAAGAANVIASGCSPIAMGLLIDADVSLATLAAMSVGCIAVAVAVAARLPAAANK